MPFTAAELEAMRIADAEIERDFNPGYAHSAEHKEIDRWLDDQAKIDTLDNQTRSRKRKLPARNKAYYEVHKDEIAARNKAYREAHKDELAAYQKAYREAKKSRAGTAIPSAEHEKHI